MCQSFALIENRTVLPNYFQFVTGRKLFNLKAKDYVVVDCRFGVLIHGATEPYCISRFYNLIISQLLLQLHSLNQEKKKKLSLCLRLRHIHIPGVQKCLPHTHCLQRECFERKAMSEFKMQVPFAQCCNFLLIHRWEFLWCANWCVAHRNQLIHSSKSSFNLSLYLQVLCPKSQSGSCKQTFSTIFSQNINFLNSHFPRLLVSVKI